MSEGSSFHRGSGRPRPTLAEGSKAPRFWAPGGFYRILLSARQTGGAVAVLESEESQGDAPPMHLHTREDETFYILEGVYDFVVGQETYHAEAGSLVFCPRGLPHGYRVETPVARWVCAICPGGVEGMFADVGVAAPSRDFEPPQGEPDLARFDAIAERYGVTIVGPVPRA